MLKALLALALAASVALAGPYRQASALEWQADLDELVQALEATHPDPWAGISKDEFTAAYQAVRADIPTLSEERIAFSIARLLASLGDPRVYVNVEPAMLSAPILPLQLIWLDDGVYVHAADLLHVGLIGGRVLEIEGRPVEDVLGRMEAFFAWDQEGRRRALAPRVAQFYAALALEGLVRAPTVPCRVEVERRDGQRVIKAVKASAYGSRRWRTWVETLDAPAPLATRHARALSAWEFLPEDRAMYLAYNRCLEDPARPLGEAVDALLADADRLDASSLIVDLRFNAGGNADTTALVDALAASERFAAPGSVRVLVGRATMSEGAALAQALRNIGAVLIGETTGTGPEGFGPVEMITLSRSGIVVQCPTAAEAPPPPIEPDTAVAFLGPDLFAGRDAALEAALEHPAPAEPEELTTRP